MKLLIKNGYLVDPASGRDGLYDLIIKDGAIAQVGADLPPGGDAEMLDAAGMHLFPGLVDVHCHLREPGFEYKETIESGTRAAAAGGFTSVCCMANTDPVVDNGAMAAFIVQRAKETGAVRVHPIGALSKGLQGKEIAEIGDMKAAGAVAISDDGKPVMNGNLMRLGMMYAAQFGLTVIDHCEDLDLVNDGVINDGYTSTILGLRGNSRSAEQAQIARDAILSKTYNLPIHIAHVSAKESVEIIRQAKARGARITAETAPHYLSGTDEMALNYDPYTRVNPPLREKEDVAALIEGLLDGTIDCIATDHAPHHRDDKLVEYALAANGISGFESAFALCYTALVASGRMPLTQLIQKMTVAPARLFNLRAGTLAEGAQADITIADLSARYALEPEKFVSKGKNNPFGGKEVCGRIVRTLVSGRTVYLR